MEYKLTIKIEVKLKQILIKLQKDKESKKEKNSWENDNFKYYKKKLNECIHKFSIICRYFFV